MKAGTVGAASKTLPRPRGTVAKSLDRQQREDRVAFTVIAGLEARRATLFRQLEEKIEGDPMLRNDFAGIKAKLARR